MLEACDCLKPLPVYFDFIADAAGVLIWMNSNKLKLDTDKTEVMSVASASFVALVETECANIGGNSVPFKTQQVSFILSAVDITFGDVLRT